MSKWRFDSVLDLYRKEFEKDTVEMNQVVEVIDGIRLLEEEEEYHFY